MEKEASGVQIAKRPSDPYLNSVILSNGKEVPICKAGSFLSYLSYIFCVTGETICNPISA